MHTISTKSHAIPKSSRMTFKLCQTPLHRGISHCAKLSALCWNWVRYLVTLSLSWPIGIILISDQFEENLSQYSTRVVFSFNSVVNVSSQNWVVRLVRVNVPRRCAKTLNKPMPNWKIPFSAMYVITVDRKIMRLASHLLHWGLFVQDSYNSSSIPLWHRMKNTSLFYFLFLPFLYTAVRWIIHSNIIPFICDCAFPT